MILLDPATRVGLDSKSVMNKSMVSALSRNLPN